MAARREGRRHHGGLIRAALGGPNDRYGLSWQIVPRARGPIGYNFSELFSEVVADVGESIEIRRFARFALGEVTNDENNGDGE